MAKKPTQQSSPIDLPPPDSFEEAVVELEALVSAMDAPNVGLDQLVKDYKRGAQLVQFCRNRLNTVRQEVLQIEADLLKEDSTGGAV
jgi:exodeoxyribonuclease VII small subunit